MIEPFKVSMPGVQSESLVQPSVYTLHYAQLYGVCAQTLLSFPEQTLLCWPR